MGINSEWRTFDNVWSVQVEPGPQNTLDMLIVNGKRQGRIVGNHAMAEAAKQAIANGVEITVKVCIWSQGANRSVKDIVLERKGSHAIEAERKGHRAGKDLGEAIMAIESYCKKQLMPGWELAMKLQNDGVTFSLADPYGEIHEGWAGDADPVTAACDYVHHAIND